MLYVNANNGSLYGLDNSTGLKKWEMILSKPSDGDFSSPALVNDMLFVGSIDFKLYALDAGTGAQIWSFTSGGTIYSSPCVLGKNGKVYHAGISGLQQ
ncbi:PQQ-binding-like beta-propeller repeat protein [Pseudarcicella hirudinis]